MKGKIHLKRTKSAEGYGRQYSATLKRPPHLTQGVGAEFLREGVNINMSIAKERQNFLCKTD